MLSLRVCHGMCTLSGNPNKSELEFWYDSTFWLLQHLWLQNCTIHYYKIGWQLWVKVATSKIRINWFFNTIPLIKTNFSKKKIISSLQLGSFGDGRLWRKIRHWKVWQHRRIWENDRSDEIDSLQNRRKKYRIQKSAHRNCSRSRRQTHHLILRKYFWTVLSF